MADTLAFLLAESKYIRAGRRQEGVVSLGLGNPVPSSGDSLTDLVDMAVRLRLGSAPKG
jgi:hypothetical protein